MLYVVEIEKGCFKISSFLKIELEYKELKSFDLIGRLTYALPI